MPRMHSLAGPSLALLLLIAASPASAATCTWNVPTGNWSVAGNWLGCADQPGPSTRTPGAADTALLSTGAAILDTDASVGQFEIGAAATLTLVGGAARTLTVSSALRLAGGTVATSNTGAFPVLYLVLAPGASGQVLASSTLSNTVELQNNGQLNLQSASGTTLVFQGLSRLINLPGSTFAVGGGTARVHLDGQAQLTVQADATLATSGDVFIGRSLAAAGTPRIESFGTVEHTGPGTLTIQGAGSGATDAAVFKVEGLLSIRNGTIVCNALADTCRHQNGGGLATLRIELDNGHYSRGGPTALPLSILAGSELAGTGSIDGAVTIAGRLSPGGVQGPPYGSLTVTGALQFAPTSVLAIDLAGALPGLHDQVHTGNALTYGGSSYPEGLGVLELHLAPGYQPPLGEQVAVLTYPSVVTGSALHRVDANGPQDYATRFDPTALQVFPAPRLTVEQTSVVEGNAGSAWVNVNVRLSQASALPVGAGLQFTEGTASNGPLPAGDYVYPGPPTVQFAPGEVVKPVQVLIHGDLAPEADEAFTLSLVRNTISNAAVGNGVPGHPRGVITILTDDLPPDTRFVLVGKDSATAAGSIKRYTSTGTLIDVWGPTTSNGGGGLATGLCFGPDGALLSTRFTHTNPILYSNAGAVLDRQFARGPGTVLPFNFHESCAYDRDGDVYIGQAGGASSPDSAVPVRKFDRHGVPLEDFVLPTGPRGTDWIELAGDQCTLYYTSEDTVVRRYNVCTRTVLPDFAVGLTPPVCYALRLRPNRELMVACQDAVHRISPQGANLQTYTRQSLGESNPQGLFALNLDPDGTSFWTAGGASGWVYRVDIASGAVLTSFNSGPGAVGGLAIYDEPGDDSIFIDGFETAPVPAPIVASGPSSHLYREMRRCEKEFSPRNVPLPHFVPYWVALVVVQANDCWH